jgi:hypothetical protein
MHVEPIIKAIRETACPSLCMAGLCSALQLEQLIRSLRYNKGALTTSSTYTWPISKLFP